MNAAGLAFLLLAWLVQRADLPNVYRLRPVNVYGHVTLDSQRDALDLLRTQLGAGAESTDGH